MEKWYKKLYRRHLLDMHVNDDEAFYLSKFSAEKYFANLKKAKIQSPMIYLQAHTGLCYFPTELTKTHAAMQEKINGIKKLVTLCKQDGMKVVGYYSLIFNNCAEDAHPEWAIRYANGKTWREEKKVRYGLCCPNNAEYRKFVVAQIKELFAYYPELDGIFYDMPYWEVTCSCDACKKRFRDEYGKDIPKEDLQSADFREFMVARQNWMGEFCEFVENETHKIAPDVTVEFNYAAAVNCTWLAGSTEKISAQSEFASGDLLGGLRMHSFACKYYYGVTENQPFEYMNTRCDDCLREHTISKTEEKMRAEVMLNCAHHGASLSIDAINLDGTMDERVYQRLGKVFESQLPYEKVMDEGELYAEVGVYFNSDIQFDQEDGRPSNKTCAVQAHTTLCERHVPCAIVTNFEKENLSKYQAIVVPALLSSENSLAKRLIKYVEDGGFLYLSGKSDEELVKEFFSARVKARKSTGVSGHYAVCYVSPKAKIADCFGEFNEDYPLPLSYNVPETEFEKGEVLATVNEPVTDPEDFWHFGSIHSNPPYKITQKPVMLECAYGKGKVFWTLAEIEADDRSAFKDVFVSIIKKQLKNRPFEVEANGNVEVVTFRKDEKLFVGFYNYGYEQMPDVKNKAKLTFDRKIKVNPVNGEKITMLGDNSFETEFNLFACVEID